MIKYKFAKTKSEQIIDIQDLSKEKKQSSDQFFCLGCENEMLPVLGNKRIKHFRHKQIELNCQPETYLHKLAKSTFYQTYQKCIEEKQKFFIQFHVESICNHYEDQFSTQCKLSQELQEFEITRYFSEVQLETKIGQFIPDIVLYSHNSKNDKIFVEIAVTHESSVDKLRSGNRIIEIKIQTEDDIELCKQLTLKESRNVSFFNFKKSVIRDYCQGQCTQIKPHSEEFGLFRVFVVYPNATYISDVEYADLLEIASSESVIYYRLLPFTVPKTFNFHSSAENFYEDALGEIYRSEIVRLFSNGTKIKNCFLCRYHAINKSCTYDGSIFCKFLKKSGNSNMAYECEYFKADKNVFEKYLLSTFVVNNYNEQD